MTKYLDAPRIAEVCGDCGARHHRRDPHVYADVPVTKPVKVVVSPAVVVTQPVPVLTDTNDGVNNGVNAIDGGVNRSSDRHSAGYMQAYMARRRAMGSN